MPKVMPNGATGHGGGGGRRRRPRVTTALSEINVVPLVDVMLVLLIIFMVAAPMMQQGLNVNLPQSRRAPAMPPASDPIYVTVPVTFARNRLVQLGNECIRLDVLGRAHPPARPAARRQAGVPAQRRPGDHAADHGRDGSPEGRRRREGRPRVAAGDGSALSPGHGDDLRSRLQHHRRAGARAGRPAQDDDGVGARARRRDRRARGRCRGCSARSGREETIMDGQHSGGAPGRGHRRHDGAVGPRRCRRPSPRPSCRSRRARRRPPRRRRRWSSRSPSRRRPSRRQRQPSHADQGGARRRPARTVRPGQSRVETGSTSNEGGLSTGGDGRRQQPGQRQLLRSAVPRPDGVARSIATGARHQPSRRSRSSGS